LLSRGGKKKGKKKGGRRQVVLLVFPSSPNLLCWVCDGSPPWTSTGLDWTKSKKCDRGGEFSSIHFISWGREAFWFLPWHGVVDGW